MKLLNTISSYIAKDVSDENEAKKRTVIMRIFVCILDLYFLILSIFTGIFRVPSLSIACILFFVLYLVLLYCTYINRTKFAVFTIQLFTYLGIISYIFLFGWDCGTQHFLFVLLLLTFFSGYYSFKTNIAIAILYCASRLLLYFHCRINEPIYPLDDSTSILFQVMNTLTIFAIMTFMIYSFSKESINTEKKLVAYNSKIKALASIDPLTQLYNRRFMIDFLENKTKDSVDDATFCLCISDIDNFKKVNDTYGHEAGDEVLFAVACTIADFMKEHGTACRWGGEEFLLFFHDDNGDKVFCEIEKLRSIIAAKVITHNGVTIPVTMTFGLQEYTASQPLDYTINQADMKLYQGKKSGKNCVIF